MSEIGPENAVSRVGGSVVYEKASNFCPECQKEGAKSRVTGGISSSTLLNPFPPYWDEEGKRHNHDSNVITTHCGDNWTL